jgi:hypothetical protein
LASNNFQDAAVIDGDFEELERRKSVVFVASQSRSAQFPAKWTMPC